MNTCAERQNDPDHHQDVVGTMRKYIFTLLFISALGLGSTIVILDLGFVRRTVGILGIVATILALYGALGHRALMEENERTGAIFLFLVIPLSCMLFLQYPAFLSSLFGLYPLCFVLVRKMRAKISFAVALSLTAVVAQAKADEFARSGWVAGLILGGISLVFAIFMGTWVDGILAESTARQTLIDDLRATRAQLSLAQHEAGARGERERMSAEIHDTLAQGFSSLILLIRSAQKNVGNNNERAHSLLASAEATAQENLNEARALVHALAPVALQEATLSDAVRRIGERFQTDTGIATTVDISGSPGRDDGTARLSAQEDIVLLRSIQESLTNVRRHANATRVRIALQYDEQPIWASVTDNGIGLVSSPAAVDHLDAGEGRGLPGMRSRLLSVGGSLRVESPSSGGTTITASLS